MEALHAKHGYSAGSDTTVRQHARSLAFNLKRNGSNLKSLTPTELVQLSANALVAGSIPAIVREKALLGGWDPPPPTSSLPADAPWLCNKDLEKKRIVFVLREKHVYEAYANYFVSIPRVQVLHNDIIAVEGPVNAFVSPANTTGNMDGGIDRVYADFFGWSYGRPYHDPSVLQQAIDKAKGEPNIHLPVGEAILARDERGHALIAAPTMVVPSKIKIISRTVFLAYRAAFDVFRRHSDIHVIRVPSFGTGYGQVPGKIAAAQTWQAKVGLGRS